MAATRRIDGLQTDGAEVPATYDRPHFGRFPAITTRAHGHGRTTVVGTLPNRVLAAALFRCSYPRRRRMAE